MKQGIIVRFYRLLLRLYPREHRDAFGEEMVGVFALSLAERRNAGNLAVVVLLLRELLALPAALSQAHAHSWRAWQPALASQPGWPWVVGWIAATTAALPLAWLLMIPLVGILLLLFSAPPLEMHMQPDILQIIAFLIALATTMALAQWALLRRHLPGAGWWLVATIAGWLAGGVLAAMLFGIWALATNSTPSVLSPTTIIIIVLSLLGLVLGFAQWQVLNRLTRHASWWIVINILAFASILVAGRSIGSIPELVLVLTLPGSITALGLWWILARTPRLSAPPETVATVPARFWVRRPRILAFFAAFLFVFCAGAPWVYAVVQIELARRDGLYATVEEAVLAGNSVGWGGAKVLSVENVYAGPNSNRDGMEHVWFGGATVKLDRVPQGGRWTTYENGSYYLQLHDGWVHMPEGAFPNLVGRLMVIYDLENVGGD